MNKKYHLLSCVIKEGCLTTPVGGPPEDALALQAQQTQPNQLAALLQSAIQGGGPGSAHTIHLAPVANIAGNQNTYHVQNMNGNPEMERRIFEKLENLESNVTGVALSMNSARIEILQGQNKLNDGQTKIIEVTTTAKKKDPPAPERRVWSLTVARAFLDLHQ